MPTRRFGHHVVVALTIASTLAPSFALAAPRGGRLDRAARLDRLGGRVFAPSETLELDGGEKVSAAKYAEELNQLQEALETDGVSLKKADGRAPKGALPLYAGASEEKARDKAALVQKKERLAGIEAAGFAALRKKKAALARAAAAAPRPGAARVAGPTGSPGGDDDDALEVTYDETLGSKKRASIYVGLRLEDTGEKDKVGCDASVDGGVYLFDQKKQLVKVAASGKIAGGSISGSVDLFVLGKSVDGYPKKGSANANLSKAIAPPPAKLKYGWGPLSVDIEGSIAGELRINANNAQQGPSSSQIGRCTLAAEPMLRASAKASASVNAIAYKVGVQGQIVLVDLKTPMAASVVVRGTPAKMTEDFRASVNATFLDGDVFFFVKTRIPQKGERPWDLDWNQVYKKALFDWDGLRIDSKLASFSGKETAL